MLVAVSGGGDSVAMAALLMRFWPGKQVWAHVDHGIRDVSAEDAHFVELLARRWGIKCFIARRDVPSQRLKGESIEMAARRVRHEFLEGLAETLGLGHVAAAHTMDDQAETVMLNLTRGAGLWGLGGMPHRRDPWVRPVIFTRRWELRRYLELLGVDWVEDETNQSTDYVRNKIRLELIPWIEKNLNPRFPELLFQLSIQCLEGRRATDARQRAILPWLRRPAHPSPVGWDRKRAGCLSDEDLSEALRSEGRLLGLPSLDRIRVQEMVRKIKHKGRFSCPWKGGWWIAGDRHMVYFFNKDALPAPLTDVQLGDLIRGSLDVIEVQWGEWRIRFDLHKHEAYGASAGFQVGLRMGHIPLDPNNPAVTICPLHVPIPSFPGVLSPFFPEVLSSVGGWRPWHGSHVEDSMCDIITIRVCIVPRW